MDLPHSRPWADAWTDGLQQACVVVVMMEEAYLKSETCVAEFLASEGKCQAIVACDTRDFAKLREFCPAGGAAGCGAAIAALSSGGRRLHLRGWRQAAEDIASEVLARAARKGTGERAPCKVHDDHAYPSEYDIRSGSPAEALHWTVGFEDWNGHGRWEAEKDCLAVQPRKDSYPGDGGIRADVHFHQDDVLAAPRRKKPVVPPIRPPPWPHSPRPRPWFGGFFCPACPTSTGIHGP